MNRKRLRGRGAGAFALLLALVLLVAYVVPAYADDDNGGPPLPPHTFQGTVRVLNPSGLAPVGTVVEAFLDGVKNTEAVVDANGRYQLGVSGEAGDEDKPVTFRVAGVLANETADWQWAGLDFGFDLTIDKLPSGSLLPGLPCFIATAAYGTDTAEEIDILREFRDTVMLANSLGAGLVSLYYVTSPAIAGFISGHDVLRTAVRVGLVDPIVALLNLSHDVWSGGI